MKTATITQMLSMDRPWDEAARLDVPLPRRSQSVVVAGPPGEGPGNWAGAPSAAAGDDGIYLAYRLRRPVGAGRGCELVVAWSQDGERFATLVTFQREMFGAESLERPALVRTPEGRWRLYLSCATPGTKHWRVEMLEAGHPSRLDPSACRVVLPGDAKTAVKDPVIRYRNGTWRLWASCHPLAVPAEADQMVTDYATSPDGIEWSWHGTALAGRAGAWDARGVRVSAVHYAGPTIVAFYDGRATASENFEERTGIATGTEPTVLSQLDDGPFAQSPHPPHGLRYLDMVALPGGGHRMYYEMTRADGGHELRTERC
jgi:hypothetical protein